MIISQPKEMIAAFVSARQGLDLRAPWGEFCALGLMRHGRFVAGVIYNKMEGANVCMHIGAIDGRHWCSKEFLFAAFDYPFNQMGKRRITANVCRKNTHARSFVQNLGFKYEGTMRHYYENDDMCVYGMLRADCRHLELVSQLRKAA